MSDQAGASIPPILLDGPLGMDDVFPSGLSGFVIAAGELPNGAKTYLVDDVRLVAELPAERALWLGSWGLSADSDVVVPDGSAIEAGSAVPTEAAPGEVLLVVGTMPDGVVISASLSSPAIGGTASGGHSTSTKTGARFSKPAVTASI